MQPSIGPSLDPLFDGPSKNMWLSKDKLNVYVRQGFHSTGKDFHTFLDVANVNVEHRYRRKGIFSRWLAYAEHEAKERNMAGVYIESIQNITLAIYLTSIGYKVVTAIRYGEGDPVSMYKFNKMDIDTLLP